MREWLSSLKYRIYRDYLRNPRSRRLYEAQHRDLGEAQQQVVRDLLETGIAAVPFTSIFDDALWQTISREADGFAESATVKDAVRAWKSGDRTSTQKGYLIRKYPRHAVVTSADPWLQLALDRRMLAIANAYFGMLSRLMFFDLWYTIEDQAGRDRRGSQNWHRDAEDQNILKGFVYFTDVTEGSGPLEYVTHSRAGERNCHTSYAGISWTRSADEFSRIPPQDVVRGMGPRGTLLLCDAAGIHRGGFAIDGPRTLATWGYTTPSSLEPRRFEVSDSMPALDAAASFALTC